MNSLAMTDHGPSRVTETRSLPDRIKRFSQPVQISQTGYRRLSGNCSESLLGALLSEIDETILSRRIKLVTDTDQTVYLHVAGRRLMRISQPSEKTEPSQPVTAIELIARLQTVLVGATKAALFNIRSGAGRARPDSGYSADMLAAAASLDLASQQDWDPVPAMFTALKTQATAFVTLDPAGNILRCGGDKSWSDRLDALARHGLDDIDAQLIQSLPRPEHPGCIMLSAGGTTGAILLYARSQAAGFLAILPPEALPTVQSAWRSRPA